MLILLIIISCRTGREGNTKVAGKIRGVPGELLKLVEVGTSNSVTIDSVIIGKSGDFAFHLNLGEPGLYLLSLPPNNILIFELRPGDTVGIKSEEISHFEDAMITGSASSSDMEKFFNTTFRNRRVYDSLQNSLLSHQADPDFAGFSKKLDELLKPVWENQHALETEYIDRHLNSLTSLLVLNQGIGTSPVLTFQNDSVYFLKIDSSLGRSFPGNKHAVFHHNRILKEREMEAMKKQTR